MTAPPPNPGIDLLVERPFVDESRAPEPRVGYRVTVPRAGFPPDRPPEDGDPRDALDWSHPVPPVVRLDGIRTRGLLEPDPWERSYLDWLADDLGLPVSTDSDPGPPMAEVPPHARTLVEALETTAPWTTPGHIPPGVTLRRAATRRAAAIAFGRRVRRLLAAEDLLGTPGAAARCDGILVLLPDDLARVELWARELERFDLPVRAPVVRDLGSTAVGSWIVALAGLAGWSRTEARSRLLLREVLESPFFRRSVQGADRLPIRTTAARLLRDLRRPSVTLDGWRGHVRAARERVASRGWGDRAEAHDRILGWTEEVASRLDPADRPCRSLATLLLPETFETTEETEPLVDLKRAARAWRDESEAGPDEPDEEEIETLDPTALPPGGLREVLAGVKGVLRRLVREEAAEGGVHPTMARRDPSAGRPLADLLARRLGDTFTRRVHRPERGIALLPASLYDGRPTDLLCLAGLGEGGYPSRPTRPGPTEEAWIRALDLLPDPPADPDELTEAWAEAEMERQIRLVTHAVRRARGPVVLSFAREGPGTEEVHPGPLLSLLVGSWTDDDWTRAAASSDGRVEDVRWADELPAGIEEATCRAEGALFAARPEVRESLPSDGESPEDEEPDPLTELAEKADQLETSLEAARARRPVPADREGPFGPWAGRLPGPADPPEVMSPTSVDAYGQCPSHYFFGRFLGLDAEEDAPIGLDPLEMGTVVHEVLARLTRQEADPAEGKLLRLGYPAGDEEAKARTLAELGELVDRTTAELFGEAVRQRVTLSGPYIEALADRWKAAMRSWLESHLVPEVSFDLSNEAIDRHQDVIPKLEKVRETAASLAEIERVEKEVRSDELDMKVTHWQSRGTAQDPLSGAAMKRAFRAWEESDSLELAFQSLRDEYTPKLDKRRAALEEARETVREQIRTRINHHVAHAELAFGKDPSPQFDEASLPDPVRLDTPSGPVLLKGTIDRVDWDADREVLVVRDYKSGGKTSTGVLTRSMRAGWKLQILLYAVALDRLVTAGQLPHLDGRVARAALEFPRESTSRHVTLDEPSSRTPEGEELTFAEVARRWLGHHRHRLEAGVFDLAPTACPLEDAKGAYCDFQRICGYLPARSRAPDDPDRPAFEPAEEKEGSEPERSRFVVAPPDIGHDAPDPIACRHHHDEAGRHARDVTRDLALSAGAGTGKTYQLVLRYLRALEEVPPRRILCVTFTRKAAAEMRHRIRQALLDPDPTGSIREHVPDGLREGPGLRKVLLTLSSAPIWTIDSLAGRVLSAANRLREQRGGDLPGPAEVRVVEPSVASDHLARYVRDRFLEALEDPSSPIHPLVETIHVDRLLAYLEKAVQAHRPAAATRDDDLATRRERILATWKAIIPVDLLEAYEATIAGWDLDQWSEALEESVNDDRSTYRCPEEAARAHREGIEVARKLRAGEYGSAWERFLAIQAIRTLPKTKKALGRNARFCELMYAPLQGLDEDIAPDNTEAAAFMEEWEDVRPADLEEWADRAARASLLASEWAEGFGDHLEARGLLRHGDVQARALEALRDESLRDALRRRFPFAHVFVDESQDTNEVQVDFLRELAGLGGGRLFWVGDPKQSIYRFRDAEVDVFEGLVRGEEAPESTLRVNYRSHPSLIRAYNRLFGALLPARRDGEAADPGAEVPYTPLTWPAERDPDDDGTPRVELIASPKRGSRGRWGLPSEDEATSEDPADDETPTLSVAGEEATEVEQAVVERVRRLLDDDRSGRIPDHGRPLPIALLVARWRDATRYRDLLALRDVPAVVQGGSGLLSTREVDHLLLWLEAAVRRDRVAFVGTLRGPGVALSDAALACLRKGWGLEPTNDATAAILADHEPPHRPATVARLAGLDPDRAVAEWAEDAPDLDQAEARTTLARDAASLKRHRDLLATFRDDLERGTASSALELLVENASLRTFWMARPHGRQAVANIEVFLDLVRDLERTETTTAHGLLRTLDRLKEGDDPASGGLEAGGEAEVCITTYWQAKGREWPVVVLPDLHKTKAKVETSGLGTERVVLPPSAEAKSEVHQVRELVHSPAKAPFKTTSVDTLKSLVDVYRAPAERAESRRILYVSMTRAMEHLVLAGTFKAPNDDSLWHPELLPGTGERIPALTLDRAKTWADTILLCTDLSFDDANGQPSLGPCSLWEEGRHVTLTSADNLTESPAPEPGPTEDTTSPSSNRPDGWRPVTSPTIDWLKPSRAPARPVSDPINEPDWPTELIAPETPFPSEALEGTAFHLLVECWGFGHGDPRPIRELSREALDTLGLDSADSLADLVDTLTALHDRLLTGPADLLQRLEKSAAEGRLYPEIPVSHRYNDKPTWTKGLIDLCWQDETGLHLLDLKVGRRHPTTPAPLEDSNLQSHKGQVDLYSEAINSITSTLSSHGVWYVIPSLCLRWRCSTHNDKFDP